MEPKIIKEKISYFLNNIGTIIKEIWGLPKAKLYIFISVPLVLFFLIATFPYETLFRSGIQKLEKSIGANISLGDMDFNIIGDTYIDNISIFLKDGSEINLKDITIDLSFNPYSILVNKSTSGTIDIRGIKYEKRDTAIDGLISCTFDAKADPKRNILENGSINIKAQDTKIKGMTIKGFDIPEVKFTSIIINGIIKNNVLTTKKVNFSGSDLRGKINGKVHFSKRISNSRLDLKIEINNQSKILQTYKPIIDTFVEPGQSHLEIGIKGTISKPQVNMPKARIKPEEGEPEEIKDEKTPPKESMNKTPTEKINKVKKEREERVIDKDKAEKDKNLQKEKTE